MEAFMLHNSLLILLGIGVNMPPMECNAGSSVRSASPSVKG
jgi:hypothetical protein